MSIRARVSKAGIRFLLNIRKEGRTTLTYHILKGQIEIEVAKETKKGKIEEATQYLTYCMEKKDRNVVVR